jgi:hypothetical protein
MLPILPSNEKNSSNHHNSYNKGPNLALFSFTESPSNSLPTIKFPKNHITSSYHWNLPKTANAIFVHQRPLGVKNIKHLNSYNIRHSYNEGFYFSYREIVAQVAIKQKNDLSYNIGINVKIGPWEMLILV